MKGASDFKKFEKARKLKVSGPLLARVQSKLIVVFQFYVDGIRLEYETQLKDKVMQIRQRATAVYLIDRFALRAGNEKGEDEADTVGCCSLKCSNITLTPPCNVLFDFLGKDSIRFLQAYDVSEQVFKNLRIFKKEPKTDDDLVFDRLNVGSVLSPTPAAYLTCMFPRPGLSTTICAITWKGFLRKCSVLTMPRGLSSKS